MANAALLIIDDAVSVFVFPSIGHSSIRPHKRFNRKTNGMPPNAIPSARMSWMVPTSFGNLFSIISIATMTASRLANPVMKELIMII